MTRLGLWTWMTGTILVAVGGVGARWMMTPPQSKGAVDFASQILRPHLVQMRRECWRDAPCDRDLSKQGGRFSSEYLLMDMEAATVDINCQDPSSPVEEWHEWVCHWNRSESEQMQARGLEGVFKPLKHQLTAEAVVLSRNIKSSRENLAVDHLKPPSSVEVHCANLVVDLEDIQSYAAPLPMQ